MGKAARLRRQRSRAERLAHRRPRLTFEEFEDRILNNTENAILGGNQSNLLLFFERASGKLEARSFSGSVVKDPVTRNVALYQQIRPMLEDLAAVKAAVAFTKVDDREGTPDREVAVCHIFQRELDSEHVAEVFRNESEITMSDWNKMPHAESPSCVALANPIKDVLRG